MIVLLAGLVSVTFVVVVALLGSFEIAKRHLERPPLSEDERCPELSGMDRCDLEGEHDGPHRKTERGTSAVIWWLSPAQHWAEAQARAEATKTRELARQAEGAAKLEWDRYNAAPEMHPEVGRIFRQIDATKTRA